MMYNPQLDTFLCVAESGSFNKAAEKLYISPPAVIKQINLLEESLGLQLFVRTHRGLVLTEAGKSLFQDARYIIQYCKDSVTRARNAMQSSGSVIRIGTSLMTPAQVLVDLWPRLHDACPDIHFQLIPFDNTPENAREILANLGQNIDVVAGVFDETMLSLRKCAGLELSREPICCAVSLHHRLAQKDRLSIQDLYGEKLMLIRRNWSRYVDLLRDDIWKNHPQIQIVDFDFYDVDAFNRCENERVCADGGGKLALCAPAAQDPASGLELHHPLRLAALALAFGRGQRISARGGKDRETRVLTPEYILHNESRLLRRSRFFIMRTQKGESVLKKSSWSAIVLVLSLCLWGCSARPLDEGDEAMPANAEIFTADTPITTVITDPAFGQFGRMLFPADDWYYSGDTLGELQLTWYSHIDLQETVDIVNDLKTRASAGQPVFFDIYTEEEKAADPDKEDTGLFYFPGRQGAPFALCSAGGGFAYVGAMQDSLPHALALSQHGYHAFALIYRPGAQSGCEDLARAISFVYSHAEELGISTDCYSLWGGSAGARLSAWLGSYGPAAFGGDDLPRPGAVVMQYTGHSEYTTADPLTFACAGEQDGIANWRVMQRRIDALAAAGIPVEFHHYPTLGHGFGLGIGTEAEGWLEEAVAFWEAQM